MNDYKNILFKSPMPFVVVEKKENNVVITDFNDAYKMYITEKYNLIVEKYLDDNILIFENSDDLDLGQIEIDGKHYNLQVEKCEENSFIVWFSDKKYPSSEIKEKLLLNVSKFDDVFFLISSDKIIFANESYKTLFGEECKIPCSVEDGLYRFIEREDGKEIAYDYTKVIDERVKIKTGNTEKWVWIRSNPVINKNNKIVATYVILTDITNRTKHVMDLKESRENFISFVSHEIKNPLNMILATMQLIEQKVDQDIYDEDILRHVNLVRTNSYKIMKIVGDLSSKTKLEMGYVDFCPVNHDIVYFIEDICESVRDFVNINDMKIIFDTDIEELIVGFDCEKLEKMVINLISNSLKYRKKEGGTVLITLEHDDDYVYIKVRDDGIGISEENLSRVFSRYERVKDSRSIAKEGTGIGLSLVKNFAKLHSGDVSVESELGVYTEFTVKIANVLSDNNSKNCYCHTKEERLYNIEVEFSDI